MIIYADFSTCSFKASCFRSVADVHCPAFLKAIPQYCIAHPYCARVLSHLNAHVHNESYFPQAKLDSEINVSMVTYITYRIIIVYLN